MGIEEGILKYEISIGIKRATAAGVGAVIGFIGSSTFIQALAVLKVVGITVIVDQPVFEKWLTGVVSMGVVALHDFLRIRYPSLRWL